MLAIASLVVLTRPPMDRWGESAAGGARQAIARVVFFALLSCLAAAPAASLTGCQERPSPSEPSGAPGAGTATAAAGAAAQHAAEAADQQTGGRFAEIKSLLAQDPQSRIRAERLYALVEPICASGAERERFVADVVTGATQVDDPGAAKRIDALDTFEHVATSCARNALPASRELLSRAAKALPREHRIAELESRLVAAAGDLPAALEAAQRARALGSHHAIALIATIQAQLARQKSVGYQPGMLDDALKTVSIEPDHGWHIIDVTALLSTRARLLSERAIWESEKQREKTLSEAAEVYTRLSSQPFIEKTRTHALDMLCFDAADLGKDSEALCRRAAEEAAILGAAFVVGEVTDRSKFDLERLTAMARLAQRIDRMPAGSLVVVVARGDESELVPWVRPAAEILRRLDSEKKAKVVLLDRTKGPRASALARRMVELAGVEPVEVIEAEREIFASSCLSAIAAKRKTPESCPFDDALEARLIKLQPYGLTLLVGRDLDGELEDFRLYELPLALLSSRQPATEKPVTEHLKSVSDVFMLSTRGKERWREAEKK